MFSANQKTFVSFALVSQVCTRVTEELHSFLSHSELSNFFVYIITRETFFPDIFFKQCDRVGKTKKNTLPVILP